MGGGKNIRKQNIEIMPKDCHYNHGRDSPLALKG